jgi:hypothetical protein
LKEEYAFNFVPQYAFEDCRGDYRRLKFDFYISGFGRASLIELDGKQHFNEFAFTGGEEEFKKIQRYDKIKRDYAQGNELHFLHISHSEIGSIEEYIREFFDLILKEELDGEIIVLYKGVEYWTLDL